LITPLARLRPARAGYSGAPGLISTATVVRRIFLVLGLSTALLGTVIFQSFRPANPDPPAVARVRHISPALGAIGLVAAVKPFPLAPPPPAPVDSSYLRPVGGELMSGFGARSDGMHTGVDLRGRTGEPILASRKGTVSGAACGSGYGICTMIDHGGGVTTLYAHMSLKVLAGGSVERGQVIGLVGCTGSCESPHVHFEVRLNGVRVDPAFYL
jgi:murein DD-endopeptidase MepM/ murein hydrolase activator NlpD